MWKHKHKNTGQQVQTGRSVQPHQYTQACSCVSFVQLCVQKQATKAYTGKASYQTILQWICSLLATVQ